MRSISRLFPAGLALSSLVTASSSPGDRSKSRNKLRIVGRDGTNRTIFEHAATGATLDFVTNSGICETTPGVNQYSGYLSVGTNMSMWFWFFEARSNPTTAPLASWINGGPGCSSMIGLFQENGPCHFVNNETLPSLNPYSWNNYANLLFVDQPIGAGFSYGNAIVNTTVGAAPYVWTFLQAFYDQFPQYENRDFGLFTESYGGHYGPEFASYFLSQNSAIAAGNMSGQNIDLVALGINDGYIDPAITYKSYIDFSYNNTYKPIINATVYQSLTDAYNTNCTAALAQCDSSSSNADCVNATNVCDRNIKDKITGPDALYSFDAYDIRVPDQDPSAPETKGGPPQAIYSSYLLQPSVTSAIGAKATYTDCANSLNNAFARTGDSSRSFLPQLSSVVQSGVQVVVWAGDADWLGNWIGTLDVTNAINYSGSVGFNAAELANYTVGGIAAGTFKTFGNLAFANIFGAGHEIPYYQPAAAFQVFNQTMMKEPLSST